MSAAASPVGRDARHLLNEHIPPRWRWLTDAMFVRNCTRPAIIMTLCLACQKFDHRKVEHCRDATCKLHTIRPRGDDWRELTA
jgi:hypothetical protein